MTFSELFFVLVFLPVFLIIYSLTRTVKSKNIVLLIFSAVFYAFSGVGYLLLILITSFFGWFMAAHIWMAKDDKKQRKRYLIAGIIVLIAVLGFFKYTGFVEKTVNDIFKTTIPVADIVLPLGISFYIFKIISYLADVYSGAVIAEKDFHNFLIYTMCFHHVMQGPILRYGDLRPQIYDRQVSVDDFTAGMYRFIIGLSKKVIVADYCGQQAQVLLPTSAGVSSQPVLSIWVGSLFFTLQMYLDFSAYTDMALGLGRMSGFTYMENFDYPYVAVSITDFWKRWHISLSRFFRDYVYIPMGGSRVGHSRHVFNLLVVWALTGLWHGASWNFILWGLYYFVFVFIEHALRNRLGEAGHVRRFFGHVYALLVVNFGWVIFRYTDFRQLGAAIAGMFSFGSRRLYDEQLVFTVTNNLFFIIAAVIFTTPLFKNIHNRLDKAGEKNEASAFLVSAIRTVVAALLLIWSISGMAGNTYTPFLYNRF